MPNKTFTLTVILVTDGFLFNTSYCSCLLVEMMQALILNINRMCSVKRNHNNMTYDTVDDKYTVLTAEYTEAALTGAHLRSHLSAVFLQLLLFLS